MPTPRAAVRTSRTRPAPVRRSPARAPILAALACLAAAGAVAWWLWHPGRGEGPIVLISVDTLRADHLPAYGYRGVATPAIDALAADGILFERAYAHSPQTLPSHASILTGRLPFETGVRDNIGFTLDPGMPTLAERLRDRGLATGGVVSSFVLRKETGIARGFDFFDDRMPPSAPDRPMGEVQRPGEDSLQVATAWMETLASPRFFLFFHIYEPHSPYAPPERFSRFEPYDGEIAWSDEIVGRLIAWLKERRLYDTATIVFLSDHGEGLGEHGEQEHGLFLYDATTRVPLIVKLPGAAGAGRRVSAPVQHVDLVPTLLDRAGASAPPGLRGRSLGGLLGAGAAGAPPADAGVYAESFYGRYHFGWSELYSLTDSRYRYIKAPRPELYDLLNDPGERANLAAARPQVIAAARAGLDTLLANARVHRPAPVQAEDLQRLQALGYVGSQATFEPGTPGESLPDPKDKAPVLGAWRQAAQLAANRRYDESIALLRRVLADSPGMKDGWLQLGVELVKSGRNEEALDAFRKLVEVDPSDPASLVSVSTVLVMLGRLDEAEAHARLALDKAGPGDTRTRTSAAEVMVKAALARKDYAGALRFGRLAEQADPGFPLAAFVEGVRLHDAGALEQALPVLEDAVRRQEGHPFAIHELRFYLGDTLANLGREREAEAALRDEVKLFPQNTRAQTSLAALYRAGGRFADAERVLDTLVRTSPTPEAYAMAIRAWRVFGERARAEALRAEAQKRFGPRFRVEG